MVSFKEIDLNRADIWLSYLNKLPNELRDIYFLPEYYQIYQSLGQGVATCIIYEDGEKTAIYPFLKNCINDLGFQLDSRYFDIQGAYGYNGVITNLDSSKSIISFFKMFDEYCLQNNIVAEFMRINPLIKSPLLLRPDFSILHEGDNVYVDLTNNNIFETEFEYSTRKNVRKAIRSGLSYRVVSGADISDTDLNSFITIYQHTMDRNNSDRFYYFKTGYFSDLSKKLGGQALFAFVLLNDDVISCELILLSKKIAYSFLGGTISDYYQYRPNDYLKYETINLLKKKGFESYLLGGGQEGILRYKKTFSKRGIVAFNIGKKVHNHIIYDDLVRQWNKKDSSKNEKYGGYTLKYRY
jgi:hypothetical protein